MYTEFGLYFTLQKLESNCGILLTEKPQHCAVLKDICTLLMAGKLALYILGGYCLVLASLSFEYSKIYLHSQFKVLFVQSMQIYISSLMKNTPNVMLQQCLNVYVCVFASTNNTRATRNDVKLIFKLEHEKVSHSLSKA